MRQQRDTPDRVGRRNRTDVYAGYGPRGFAARRMTALNVNDRRLAAPDRKRIPAAGQRRQRFPHGRGGAAAVNE